ncbi:hypothetical protein BJV78DRAFT_822775 [Lactifluus subvellereus]|nr:hypothetical protein BJV78DRAFT_822775 [Lactifluus subvellereus]
MCWKGMDKARSQACWHTRAHTRSTRAVMAVTAASQPKIALCICQAHRPTWHPSSTRTSQRKAKQEWGWESISLFAETQVAIRAHVTFPHCVGLRKEGAFFGAVQGVARYHRQKEWCQGCAASGLDRRIFVFLGYSSICVREITYTVASSQRVIIIIASPTSPAHLFRRGHGRTQRPVAPSGVFLSRISNESASPSRP